MMVTTDRLRTTSGASSPPRAAVLPFVGLLVVLSIPFWWLGAVTALHLAPGLPVSALMCVCPMAAALVLAGWDGGPAAAKALLARAVDLRRLRSPVWYLPVFLLMPGVLVLSYGVARLLGPSHPPGDWSFGEVLGLLLVFVLSGLAEELGWSGYALDALQPAWGALGAGLCLGVVWAAWHLVPLAQAGRPPTWMAWWSLGTVAARVVLVWLYNTIGQSVAAVALAHATQNVSWQLYPAHGSHYDPQVTALVLTLVAVLVTALSGRRRLARAPAAG